MSYPSSDKEAQKAKVREALSFFSSNGKTKINVGQTANASINQGGNAISINAVDIGVVRIRPQ